MADVTVSSNESYLVQIDSNNNNSDKFFRVYKNLTNSGSNILLTVAENNKFMLGDDDLEINWSSNTIGLDGNWKIKHISNTSSDVMDITIESNDDLILTYGVIGQSGANHQFLVKLDNSTVFEIDSRGDTIVKNNLDVDGGISANFSINAGLSMQCVDNFFIASTNVSNPPPPVFILDDISGTKWYFWVDTSGRLRVETSRPTNGNQDTHGSVVGP